MDAPPHGRNATIEDALAEARDLYVRRRPESRARHLAAAEVMPGGNTRTVLFHALPNAIGPIANAVALSLSYLLGGVIIIEVIFNYPGIAKLMVDGVAQRDMPLVQACAMIFCAAYLILVMLADVCGIVANPRLRHQ